MCFIFLPFTYACVGNTLETPSFESLQWKNFESRMQGKIINFEFPVEIKDTNSFEFNSGMPPPRFNGDPRNEIRVISLQAGLDIGWIHASKKLGLGIYLVRKKAKALSSHSRQMGQNFWKISVPTMRTDADSLDESYLTELSDDYDLLFWISADNVNGHQRAVLKMVAQRILGSITIQDEKK